MESIHSSLLIIIHEYTASLLCSFTASFWELRHNNHLSLRLHFFIHEYFSQKYNKSTLIRH